MQAARTSTPEFPRTETQLRGISRCFGLLLWLLPLLALARPSFTDSLPQGRFLRPTVRVGEIIEYELTYRHAPSLEVIFPDSAAEFAPF